MTVDQLTERALAPAEPIVDWLDFDFDTRQVHAGEYPDKNTGLRVPPIALSAGYVFDSFDDQADRFAGRSLVYFNQPAPPADDAR